MGIGIARFGTTYKGQACAWKHSIHRSPYCSTISNQFSCQYHRFAKIFHCQSSLQSYQGRNIPLKNLCSFLPESSSTHTLFNHHDPLAHLSGSQCLTYNRLNKDLIYQVAYFLSNLAKSIQNCISLIPNLAL